MEGYCSTRQSPQWAVEPVEGEEDKNLVLGFCLYHSLLQTKISGRIYDEME